MYALYTNRKSSTFNYPDKDINKEQKNKRLFEFIKAN